MPKVTILGAGITGMTIASQLPSWYDITIIAKDLPGDALNKEWASPWAAALWVGVHESTLREQQMQLDAFSRLWRLAETNPESSLRQTEMTEIMGTGSKSQVWYQDKVPDFRFLDEHELPEGSLYGMKYKTVVLTPTTFLPWMRTQLEARGVHFKRAHIQKLADLKGLGHDVLVNAAGIGPKYLKDVSDENLQHVRLQSLILKSDYNKSFIRRGLGYYSTAFSRLDGTVYVGGVIEYGNDDLNTYDKQRDLLIQRAHENNPDIFPSPDPKDYNIISDLVGRYPMRKRDKGGVRVEKEIIGDQKVVHAYGQHAGGYVFSFGLARVVANLVDEFLFESPVSSCL